MTSPRVTFENANLVVERKKQNEIGFWSGIVGMTVHAITRCLSKKDMRGVEYYAQMQDEANRELSSWRWW